MNHATVESGFNLHEYSSLESFFFLKMLSAIVAYVSRELQGYLCISRGWISHDFNVTWVLCVWSSIIIIAKDKATTQLHEVATGTELSRQSRQYISREVYVSFSFTFVAAFPFGPGSSNHCIM